MSTFETIDLAILDSVTGADANSGKYCGPGGLDTQTDVEGGAEGGSSLAGFKFKGRVKVSHTKCK
jgi:hypothetical protein